MTSMSGRGPDTQKHETSTGTDQDLLRIARCLQDSKDTGRKIDTYAYEILGVPEIEATNDSIRVAYRAILKKSHEDVSQVDTDIVKALTVCNDAISTSENRELYGHYMDPRRQARVKGTLDFKDFRSEIVAMQERGIKPPWEQRIQNPKVEGEVNSVKLERMLRIGQVPVELPADPSDYYGCVSAATEYFLAPPSKNAFQAITFARTLHVHHPEFADLVVSNQEVTEKARALLRVAIGGERRSLGDALQIATLFPLEREEKLEVRNAFARYVCECLKSGNQAEIKEGIQTISFFNGAVRESPLDSREDLRPLHLHPDVSSVAVKRGLSLCKSRSNPQLLNELISVCRFHNGSNAKDWNRAVLSLAKNILNSTFDAGDKGIQIRQLALDAYPYYQGSRTPDDVFVRQGRFNKLLRSHIQGLRAQGEFNEVASLTLSLGISKEEYRKLIQPKPFERVRSAIAKLLKPRNPFTTAIRNAIWNPNLDYVPKE